MAITVSTAVNTSGNQTTGFTLVMTVTPAIAVDDICVICITNRGATADPSVTDNDTGGNTWTKVHNQNADTNGAGTIWWKRATSATAGKTITVSGCTNSASGTFVAFRGASKAIAPFAGTTPVGEANASGNNTQAQITTAIDNSMVLISVHGTSNDTLNPNTMTATSPSSLPELGEGLSSGGSDCCVSLSGAIKATAGATGAFNWSMGTNGTTASIAVALRPELSTDASVGSFTETGVVATLLADRSLAGGASTGAIALTGLAATLTVASAGVSLSVDPGSFATSGVAATVVVDRALSGGAEAGTSVLTGASATLLRDAFLAGGADTGSLGLTGNDASLTIGKELSGGAEASTLSMTGVAAMLLRDASLASGAAPDSFSVTGFSAALEYSGATPPEYSFRPYRGSKAKYFYGEL